MARNVTTNGSNEESKVIATISLDDLYDDAQRSTAGRVAFVDQLFADLISTLRDFYQCRETSLTTTNVQQAQLWWGEAKRLWDEAGKPESRNVG